MVANAAAIAWTFKLDPVAVLNETDPFRAQVRDAATQIIADARAGALEDDADG